MDILSIAIIGITVFFALFGTLFGLKRGAVRSAVRLGIVVLAFLITWLAKGAYVNAILSIDIEGQTLNEMLIESMGDMGALSEIVVLLVESLLGIILFVLVFLALKFITAIIFFVIGFFLPKGKRGIGTLIGLAQGLLIAFCICAPLNGLFCDVGRVMNLEFDGEPVMPEETKEEMVEMGLDFDGYSESFISKIYSAVGGGLYRNVASSEKDGVTVSLPGSIEAIETGAKFVEAFMPLTEEDDVDEDTILETFKELNDIKNSMSNEGKEMLNLLISVAMEAAAGEDAELAENLSAAFENVDFAATDFEYEGTVFVTMSNYMEGEASAEDAVKALADSTFFLPIMEAGLEINGGDFDLGDKEAEFIAAIDNLEDEEKAERLRECFGLD